jgi:hypothetical protein
VLGVYSIQYEYGNVYVLQDMQWKPDTNNVHVTLAFMNQIHLH